MAPYPNRPYQQEAINTIMQEVRRETYTGVVQLPTGVGKSQIEQELPKQHFPIQQARTLLAPGLSRSLAYQALEGVRAQYPETSRLVEVRETYNTHRSRMVPGSGLVMGQRHNDVSARFVVASMQTIGPRTLNLKKKIRENDPIEAKDLCRNIWGGIELSPQSQRQWLISPRFDQILQHGPISLWEHDEAHHAPADGMHWLISQVQRIHKHLDIPPIVHVGYTATPFRADGRGMSNCYDVMYYQKSDSWAVEQGFIVPIENGGEVVRVQIKTAEGRQDELQVAENWTERVLQGYMDHCHGQRRCTISYVGKINGLRAIDAARELQRYFCEHGIPTAHVDGEYWIDTDGTKRPNSQRKKLWNRVENGEVKHLTNFNVFIEGIDLKIVDCVQIIRPFNEVNLTQAIGRARRLYPGKKDARVIDYTGQQLVMLVAGEMGGITIDPFKRHEEIEEPGKEDDIIAPGTSMKDLSAPGTVQGVNNVYKTVNITRRSEMVWYKAQNGNISMAVSRSKDGSSALLITMPDHTLSRYYKDIAAREGVNERVREVATQLSELLCQFTLWHTQQGDKQEILHNDYKIRNHIVVGREPRQQMKEFDRVEEYAADYAKTVPGYDKSIAAKKNDWRKRDSMSDKQRPLFVGLFPHLDPDKFTGGEASQRIAHHFSETAVMKLINNAKRFVEESLK
jgi:hypothetical protein